ncbi:MAG: ATP-binding cassette domain-containing protein, partial [Bacteroidales bacterium]|nr:ATP-binding cassette domain-containing protein [Bacteroidales bacterium]
MALDNVITLENAVIGVNDHTVLSDVNLSVGKSEFVYVIGRVGSGKTSLIKTLNAELPLMEGTGIVTGFQLEKIKRKEIPQLRRNLGIVFQDFKLLIDRTVDSNLEFTLKATGWKNKGEIKDRIAEVLEKVDLGYKG